MVKTLVRTLVSRVILLIIMVVMSLPIVILLLLPERMRYDSLYACICKRIFYLAVLRGSFLPITVIGIENIIEQPAVIVANHQSSLDIPLVGSLLGLFPHVWLATKELMVSPILRWILPKATVLVDMSSPLQGMRSLVRAIDACAKHRRHVVVFPEGGRYADGSVHRFYGGFVILAKKTARPVIPVLIRNAYKVYPRGAFLIYYHPIQVIVGKPMYKLDNEADEHFKERVHTWFINTERGQ